MPITITITDPTPDQISALFGYPGEGGPFVDLSRFETEPATEAQVKAPLKPVRQSRKVDVIPSSPVEAIMSPEEVEMAREIAADIAEAEPAPVGAAQVVDAGTGKPMVHDGAEPLDPAEIRTLAVRLAQKDTPALAKLLRDVGATKLSEVADKDMAGVVAAITAALS